MLLLIFNSAYCDECTFDCLEVKVGVFGGVASIYNSSPDFICRISFISLLCVFDRNPWKLFFFFFFISVCMYWMSMLFSIDFLNRNHLTAIQSSHFFFVMFDLEIGGSGDKLVCHLFRCLLSHLSVVPYYKLTYVALQKVWTIHL
jgi:hypothetical protein